MNFIFDLYGTLADIRTDESSPAFRRKFLSKYVGLFGEDFFEKLAEEERKIVSRDPQAEPDFLRIFSYLSHGGDVSGAAADFRKMSRKKLRLYPHVKSMLKRLKESGSGVYLLSNAQSCFTRGELKELKIENLFDGIELSSDFGYKKPSPKFFGYLVGKYRLTPSECLYTGNDFKADILGAKAAGFKTAYVHTAISPDGDRIEEARKTADYVAENHLRLKKILCGCALDNK